MHTHSTSRASRYASRSCTMVCVVVGTSFLRVSSSAACTLHASNAGSWAVWGAGAHTRNILLRRAAVGCSVLQCAAVGCSVLQCVAECCSGLRWVAVCFRVLQCVAVCCRVLQCVTECCRVLQCVAECCSKVLQCVAECCSKVLQCAAGCCVAVCCMVLPCVAGCCSVSYIYVAIPDAQIIASERHNLEMVCAVCCRVL